MRDNFDKLTDILLCAAAGLTLLCVLITIYILRKGGML